MGPERVLKVAELVMRQVKESFSAFIILVRETVRGCESHPYVVSPFFGGFCLNLQYIVVFNSPI